MKVKIGTSPSYLVRNPYTYCFRMNVPQDLQKYVGRKELRYSLNTGYLANAKNKARFMAGQVQGLFKFLRECNSSLMNLPENQIQELIDKYLKDLIKDYEKPLPPFGTSEKDMPPFTDQETFDGDIRDLDVNKGEYILDRVMGEYSRIKESADRLLRENGVDEIDKNLDRVNPFSGLRLKEKVRADQKRDTFSKEDLEKLFCLSPEYGQDTLEHAHHFWIPLIGLYTGARLEEICQLLKTDVINRNGY